MKESRIAFVTGGTGGIGSAISQRLCSEGYRVVAGYFNSGSHDKAQQWQKDMLAAGHDIAIQFGNVSDLESAQAMVAAIREQHGPISVLVNCAGITRDARLQKMKPESWNDVVNTNLSSVFNVTRHVIDDMVQMNFGRIINISSINGQKGQFGQTNYSAAKAGLYGFSKALAQEVAARGITVNTISPGYVETDMIFKVPDTIRNQILAQIPVGRFGKPSEIARLVAFLADDESGFITGADYSINGGHYMS